MYSLNSQRAIDLGYTEDLEIIFPDSTQLQLDIDDSVTAEVFERNRGIIEKHFGIVYASQTISRNGEGRHITITLKKRLLNEMERILLQAVLGSDPKRELLNYLQYLERDPHPVLFLENKGFWSTTIQLWKCPISRQLKAASLLTTYLNEELSEDQSFIYYPSF